MKDATLILRETVDDLLHIADQVGMTAWERNFLEDMHDRTTMKYLSDKQKGVIANLAEKYEL